MSNYIKNLRNAVGNMKLVMVTASVIVFNENNEILLMKQSSGNYWGIPGGYLLPGDRLEDYVRKNVLERCNLTLKSLKLFGVYSGPDKEFTLENGDEVAMVKILFESSEFSGFLTDHKSMRFFPLDSLPKEFSPVQHFIIRDILGSRQTPIID